jgi:hypothetical protein
LFAVLVVSALIPVTVRSEAVPASGALGFPDWLVPVVQVLEDGRVVPTTGVVLAEQVVLVPAEFAAGTNALVVLDGGADLVTHGRTAAVSLRLPLAGLAVLEVPGLLRSPPQLASGPLEDGQGVLLHALAPADLLAQGEARVQRSGRLARASDGGVSLDPSTPLPNVTGVLIDGCGQWAGYSAARGAASVSTSSATLYQWVPDLTASLAEAGIVLASGRCTMKDLPLPAAPRPSVPDPSPGIGSEPVATTEPAVLAPEPAEVAEIVEERVMRDYPELVADAEPFAGPVKAPPGQTELATEPVAGAAGAVARFAPWVLGAFVLTLLGLILHRQRQAAPAAATERAAFVLEGESQRLLIPSRNGRVDCELGRFDVEVVIEAVSVSRRHARLFGSLTALELMDLGSTNGTRVNGRPCAPRVAVAVSQGDRLILGDQAFTLQSAAGVRA